MSFQWKFVCTLEKTCEFGRNCIVVLHFYLERTNLLYLKHNSWVFATKAWVFARKIVRKHRDIEFCTWKPLSFFRGLSFFRLEFLRKRTKKMPGLIFAKFEWICQVLWVKTTILTKIRRKFELEGKFCWVRPKFGWVRAKFGWVRPKFGPELGSKYTKKKTCTWFRRL